MLVLPVLVQLAPTGAYAQAPTAQDQVSMLNIMIVEGEGAINNVKLRTAREVIVQVEDQNHKPIAGAAVVFTLPSQGPGGSFVGGSRTLMEVTDGSGRATMRGLRPNQSSGSFQINVTASFQGVTAAASVAQINAAAAGGAAASTGLQVGLKLLAIIAVAGAAAAGANIAINQGNQKAAPPPPTTITIGTPTVK